MSTPTWDFWGRPADVAIYDDDDDEPAPGDLVGPWGRLRRAWAWLSYLMPDALQTTETAEWLEALQQATLDLAGPLDALYQALGGDNLALALVRSDLRRASESGDAGGAALALAALLSEVYAVSAGRDLCADLRRAGELQPDGDEAGGPR